MPEPAARAILDALDILHTAKNMAHLISECSHTPAAATAYVLEQKIEQAEALLKGAA